MKRLLAVLLLAGASVNAQTITQTFGTGANIFSIEFVEIGNPRNAADDTGFGSVAYTYNLGKYEISREQIEKANAVGDLGISLYDMSMFGGNGMNRPATGIGWNEAARFVNWLNTSQGFQAAYNFTTSGANYYITLWAAGQYSGNNQFRHKDAYYFLPSMDEWYKGSYYDPNKAGGAGYWNYATGSDSAPTAVNVGTAANTAVYSQTFVRGPADVSDAGGLSPYGTMAQGGNVWEWMETAYDQDNDLADENRAYSGGSWDSQTFDLDRSAPLSGSPVGESSWFSNFGFRVASIPEPSSFLLLVVGGTVVLVRCRKK